MPRPARDGGAGGDRCLHSDAEPGFLPARRPRCRRRRPDVARLRQDRAHGDDALQGRRISPFRLERLLLGAVALVRPCLSGAALPDHPRHPLLADLRDRRQARPDGGEDPQDHRAGGDLFQNGIFPAAHHPLRAGGDLRLDPRRRRPGRHRRTSGDVPHGLRDLRRHRPLRDGPRSAGQALRFLVEPAAQLHGLQRVGPAAAIRERHRARGPAREQIWPQPAFLGPARTPKRPDDRSRRQSPDGAGSAAGPRPGEGIRLFRRRRRHDQSGGIDLDVVAGQGRQFPCREDRHDSGGAGRSGRPAGSSQGLFGRAAAGDGHRPRLDDRFLYVACWGTGELRQYDVTRSDVAETRGLDPYWRHRAAAVASERPGLCRRSANGRDQPRRKPGLLDQLALLDLGRPVLSRRRAGGDGQGRCRGEWRHGSRPQFCVDFPRAIGRIRSGSKAATARQTASAIPR